MLAAKAPNAQTMSTSKDNIEKLTHGFHNGKSPKKLKVNATK